MDPYRIIHSHVAIQDKRYTRRYSSKLIIINDDNNNTRRLDKLGGEGRLLSLTFYENATGDEFHEQEQPFE